PIGWTQGRPALVRQKSMIAWVVSKWVATGGLPRVVGLGQLWPPLSTVPWTYAAVPANSWSTTSVTPVLPATTEVTAGPAATALRSSISRSVKNGSVSSSSTSSWVNGG